MPTSGRPLSCACWRDLLGARLRVGRLDDDRVVAVRARPGRERRAGAALGRARVRRRRRLGRRGLRRARRGARVRVGRRRAFGSGVVVAFGSGVVLGSGVAVASGGVVAVAPGGAAADGVGVARRIARHHVVAARERDDRQDHADHRQRGEPATEIQRHPPPTRLDDLGLGRRPAVQAPLLIGASVLPQRGHRRSGGPGVDGRFRRGSLHRAHWRRSTGLKIESS